MANSVSNQISTRNNTGFQGKLKKYQTFKAKKPQDQEKKRPVILWHRDNNGNPIKYNAKIADQYGINAAIILEEIRYWAIYNVHKKQDHSAYSLYRTGKEFARLLGISERNYWECIKIIKEDGVITKGELRDYCGMMNIYFITQKYFEVAGLETISRVEREIFYPNKEDMIPRQEDASKTENTHVQEGLSETNKTCRQEVSPKTPTPPQKEVEKDKKLIQLIMEQIVNFVQKGSARFAEGFCTENGDFSQNDAGYSEKSSPPNIEISKKDPLTPHRTNPDKSDFVDGLEECVLSKTDALKTCLVEDQENVKIRSAKKRQPNERKKPLQGFRKVKSPARIEVLEGFEALHGFPSSLCREKHEEFYNAYPKKADKEASYRAFVKVLFLLEISFNDLLTKTTVFANSEDVQKRIGVEGGRYIKHSANWLWNKSWEDIVLPENPHRQRDVEKTTVQSFVDSQKAEIQPFLTHLCALIGESAFLSWFTSLAYTLRGHELVMECQSNFREEKIRLKFGQWMELALKKASLENVIISFRIVR